ncbi:CDGSH iron-sulfur domain-containing protein [Nocardioides sp.]|uniref:CDGSH iron-sulfur domain-containing protein n=1 Tax=Nocardioides sp. TaxID=35761 RepID=UPI002EDA195B
MTTTPLPDYDGPHAPSLTVSPLDDGPLRVEGSLRVVDPDGTAYELDGGSPVYLCRCGSSARKPFCDGSHARVGFAAADRATAAGGDA